MTHLPQTCIEKWILPTTAAFLLAATCADISRAAAPGYVVEQYDPSAACNGTTLLTDTHDTNGPKVVQVDMQGNIVWQYALPPGLKETDGPGFDAELLTNGNILLVVPRRGIYEINRDGTIVWSNADTDVSHDADRLANGNTLYCFGDNDSPDDAVVKEVDAGGSLVWSWYATNEYAIAPFFPPSSVYRQGWTHLNAVERLPNGNTLISPRNFNLTIEVDPGGSTVWSINWTNIYPGPFPLGYDPHEPEMLSNSNLLVGLQREAFYDVVEIDRASNIVWQYQREGLRATRDTDRLPNGNTLVVGVLTQAQHAVIFEVTPASNVVWQLRLTNRAAIGTPGWFFKAQRIPDNDQDGFQDSLDLDDDNDGMHDTDEAIAGTSPTNSNDFFHLEDLALTAAGNDVVIQWQTVTGRVYGLYSHTNLSQPWPTNPVYELAGDGQPAAYTNTAAGPAFFRVTVQIQE